MANIKIAATRAKLLPVFILAGVFFGASGPAAAQEPPKTENLPIIPPTVRPGAIEAQYELERSEGFADVPAILCILGIRYCLGNKANPKCSFVESDWSGFGNPSKYPKMVLCDFRHGFS